MVVRREVHVVPRADEVAGAAHHEVRTVDSVSPVSDASVVQRVDEPTQMVDIVPATPVAAPSAVAVSGVAPATTLGPVAATHAAGVEAVIPRAGHGRSVRRARVNRFEPAAILTAAAGVALLLMGLVAMARGGFADGITGPAFDVAGVRHTTALGIVEAAFGLVLMACGFTNARGAGMFFGAVLAIAGFVGAVQAESFDDTLAIEPGYAWILVAAGVAVLLANGLLPSITSRATVYERI